MTMRQPTRISSSLLEEEQAQSSRVPSTVIRRTESGESLSSLVSAITLEDDGNNDFDDNSVTFTFPSAGRGFYPQLSPTLESPDRVAKDITRFNHDEYKLMRTDQHRKIPKIPPMSPLVKPVRQVSTNAESNVVSTTNKPSSSSAAAAAATTTTMATAMRRPASGTACGGEKALPPMMPIRQQSISRNIVPSFKKILPPMKPTRQTSVGV